MCGDVDFKKLAGKSCLVCRRRKVKCDKTKPVCLACVKHRSTDECIYDDGYKSASPKGTGLSKSLTTISGSTKASTDSSITKPGSSRTSPLSSSQPTRFSHSNRSRVLAEIESLRKNLATLEKLLESNYVDSDFREPDDDPWFEALRGFPPMSFCDYEMVSMRDGSLAFDGPLSYRAVALKDPFLAMAIKRGHLQGTLEINQTIKRRKVMHIQYGSELSSDHPHLDAASRMRDEVKNTSNENDDQQVSDVSEVLKGHLRQNLKQINKNMNQENLETGKPLSMKHILNETEGNEFIDSRTRQKSAEQQESSSPGSDITLWKNIKKILDNLETLRSSNLKYELSRAVLPIQENMFGYSSTWQKNPEQEILVRIQSLLPPEKAVWMQIDNYFKCPIHGLYPVISEKWFRENVETIIGPNRNRDVAPIVSVSERLDFAHLGILMCVLSLSHMALVESTSQNLTKEEKYLLSHPISKECMDAAQLCMDIFKLLRKPVLPVFYCGLLIRIFRRFARDEGDSIEAEDTSSFTGLIVEVAYGLGLNTDLEKSSQFAEHEVYLHQWRKNWYLVFLLAMDEALTAGNCLSIADKSYATKLPSINMDDNGNFPSFLTNPSLEIASVNCMRSNYELALVHHKALKYVINKSEMIGCGEIHKMLDELESATAAACGSSLATILAKPAGNLEDSVVKLGAFRGFIRSKAFILLLTTALFIHLDKMETDGSDIHQSKVSISYMKKLVSMYVDLEPLLVLLFFGYDNTSDNVHRIFGRASEVIVMQACVEFLAKFVPVLYLLISRCLHLKFTFLNKKKDESNFEVKSEEHKILSSLEAVVNKGMDKLSHINAIISKLSRHNFQVWKISKSSMSMYNLLKEQSGMFEKCAKGSQNEKGVDDQETEKQETENSPVDLASYLPNSNTFRKANSSDWQEIYTLLCYTNYNIFKPYIKEQHLRMARDIRVQSERNSDSESANMEGKEDPREVCEPFSAEFIARITQNAELPGAALKSQRTGTSSSDENPQRVRKLTAVGWLEVERMSNFDDIDQLWNESILRTGEANDYTVHGSSSSGMGHTGFNSDVHLPKSAESPSNNSHLAMTSEELLKNQIIQQDHIIKQLQQLTSEQLHKLET